MCVGYLGQVVIYDDGGDMMMIKVDSECLMYYYVISERSTEETATKWLERLERLEKRRQNAWTDYWTD